MDPFIFVHNPKTAGDAIATVLGEPINHNVAFRRRIPAGAFTFCFVRNTWDRLVSWYCWHRDRSHRIYGMKTFDQWVRQGCPNDYGTVNSGFGWGPDFFGDQPIDIDGRAKGFPRDPLRQLDYVTSPSGAIIVDFIGRYEQLQMDFDRVCERLELPPIQLPHVNKTTHAPYQDYYTPLTRDLVAQLYRDDIEFFGFEFSK